MLKEQHLFEIEIINIMNVFAFMFDVSLLNKSIHFFWKNLTDHNF